MSHKPQRKSLKLPTLQVSARFIDEKASSFPDRDSWSLLDEFLGLTSDEDFRGFLGRGEFDRTWAIEGSRRITSIDAAVDVMKEWQAIIHVLSVTPRGKWNSLLVRFDPHKVERATTGHSVRLFLPEDGALAEVWASETLEAMLDAVHIDKMTGCKIHPCRLDGCLRPVRQKSKHKTLYCCGKHASLASTRRYRAKMRRKLRTAKKLRAVQ